MQLYYIYDALCGWCYGFSPVITKFSESYKNELNFHVLSGGMITGEREGPVGVVASYISEAYKVVEQRTGVNFGTAFLQNILAEGSTNFTSRRTGVAMSVFKRLHPEHQINYASDLNSAIYHNGVAPEDDLAFAKAASHYGTTSDKFYTMMQEQKFVDLTDEEFVAVTAMGISGFPTVMLQSDGQAVVLARGYITYNNLEQAYLKGREVLSK